MQTSIKIMISLMIEKVLMNKIVQFERNKFIWMIITDY